MPVDWKSRRRSDYVVALLLLIGVALRLYHLTGASLWLDETFQIALSRFPFADLAMVYKVQANPPLYYYMMWGWFKVWDTLLGDGRELETRLPSVLFAMTVLYVTWRLGRQTVSSRGACIGLGLLACSAFIIPLDQEGRNYPFMLLCATGSTLLCWSLLQGASRRTAVWYVLVTVTGLYTDLRMVFVLVGQGCAVLTLLKTPLRARIPLSLALMALSAALFAPWIPLLRSVMRSAIPLVGNMQFAVSRLDTVTATAYFLIGYTQKQPAWGMVVLGVVGWALCCLGAWRARPAGVLLLGVVAAVILGEYACNAVFGMSSFYKYYAPALPFFCLCAGEALAGLRRYAAVLLIVAYLAANSVGLSNWYYNPAWQKQNWRMVAAYLQSREAPGDAIFVSAPYMDGPLRFYHPNGPPIYGISPGGIQLNSNPVPIAFDRLTQLMLSHKRFWLLLSNDRVMDPGGMIRRWVDSERQAGHLDLEGVDFPNAPDPRAGDSIMVFLCRVQ